MSQGSSRYFLFYLCVFLLAQSHSIHAVTQQTLPTSSSKPLPTFSETQNIDTVLSEKVQSIITKTPALKGQAVTAASHDQIVTLEGSVATKQQEITAVNVAKSVKGVKQVKSQLTIKYISK